MTDPSQALGRARDTVASMRARGGYSEDVQRHKLADDPFTTTKLFEWAVIEPDLEEVRSTRRFGAPMTAFKQLLLRLLVQYHAELLAQQTRFNVNAASRLRDLEQRLEALERSARR